MEIDISKKVTMTDIWKSYLESCRNEKPYHSLRMHPNTVTEYKVSALDPEEHELDDSPYSSYLRIQPQFMAKKEAILSWMELLGQYIDGNKEIRVYLPKTNKDVLLVSHKGNVLKVILIEEKKDKCSLPGVNPAPSLFGCPIIYEEYSTSLESMERLLNDLHNEIPKKFPDMNYSLDITKQHETSDKYQKNGWEAEKEKSKSTTISFDYSSGKFTLYKIQRKFRKFSASKVQKITFDGEDILGFKKRT